jgi:hypothetical protein
MNGRAAAAPAQDAAGPRSLGRRSARSSGQRVQLAGSEQQQAARGRDVVQSVGSAGAGTAGCLLGPVQRAPLSVQRVGGGCEGGSIVQAGQGMGQPAQLLQQRQLPAHTGRAAVVGQSHHAASTPLCKESSSQGSQSQACVSSAAGQLARFIMQHSRQGQQWAGLRLSQVGAVLARPSWLPAPRLPAGAAACVVACLPARCSRARAVRAAPGQPLAGAANVSAALRIRSLRARDAPHCAM